MLRSVALFRQGLFLWALFTARTLQYVALNGYQCEISGTAKSVPSLCLFLKKQWYCRFLSLSELTCTDLPGAAPRFRLVYAFLSHYYASRVLLRCAVSEKVFLPTVVPLFAGAGWQEREVWDLFGVFFVGNPDLRRILTDYGFSGHPLRKDFPLTGFHEVVYDDRKKQIIYRPVSLAQEFRNFGAVNPWVFLRD